MCPRGVCLETTSKLSLVVVLHLCHKHGPAIAVRVKNHAPKTRNQLRLLQSRIQSRHVELQRERTIVIPKRLAKVHQEGLSALLKRTKSQRKTCLECRSTINATYLTPEKPHCPVCGYEDLVLTHRLKLIKGRLHNNAQRIEAHIGSLNAEIDDILANGEVDGYYWLVGAMCPS